MAKFFMFVALFAIVDAAYKHHPKFPKVACSGENERIRGEIIEKSRCASKEVFVYLEPQAAYEQVSPGAVWVRRCVGLCDYAGGDAKCVPSEIAIRHIPIRIYNAKTGKETCSTYPVEEHVSCTCCDKSQEDCGEGRVFNPRKCTCQCPNMQARRDCLQKRNQNMRWNRSKCACEMRRRVK